MHDTSTANNVMDFGHMKNSSQENFEISDDIWNHTTAFSQCTGIQNYSTQLKYIGLKGTI
jgi:hypothetical protein